MTVLPLIDRFALLRDSALTMLRLGLNGDILEDAEPVFLASRPRPTRSPASSAGSYSEVRRRMLVLAGVINHDIGVWKINLPIFVRDKYSGTMPPGADTVIEMSTLPA